MQLLIQNKGCQRKKGITFIVNAAIPKKCCVREIDMSNILGNLIDNAMEASQGEEEPYIDLTIRQEKTFSCKLRSSINIAEIFLKI